jgi:restriction system protein
LGGTAGAVRLEDPGDYPKEVEPMAIPDFQTIMLPLMQWVQDGKEHTSGEVIEALATAFKLTPEDRSELLPSGRQQRFNNRVHWARTHLAKAGLLSAPRRGVMQITDAGRELLASPPSRIDLNVLSRYPEFEEFRKATSVVEGGDGGAPGVTVAQTPEEAMERAYQSKREAFAIELLDRIKAASPAFFESLVVQLLVAMGYGGSIQDAASVVGKSGDEGIDGIIKEDRLGLDVIYVQAKKWEAAVGRPVIQQFAGALHGQRARKGVFITTSTFSKEARDYVSHIDPRIVLIDGRELASMMIDHNVGVTQERVYELKRVDSDFFSDE